MRSFERGVGEEKQEEDKISDVRPEVLACSDARKLTYSGERGANRANRPGTSHVLMREEYRVRHFLIGTNLTDPPLQIATVASSCTPQNVDGAHA